jgi:hypothetical protein
MFVSKIICNKFYTTNQKQKELKQKNKKHEIKNRRNENKQREKKLLKKYRFSIFNSRPFLILARNTGG